MDGAWVTCLEENPQASLRLFCFPYAGGAANVFRTWPEHLADTVEMYAVELPGRGRRWKEAPFKQLAPLVEGLAEALLPHLDKPFAFFGHSMGAVVSFELARRLRGQSAPTPSFLFVSGAGAPQVADPHRPIYNRPRNDFIDALRRFEGTPEEVLQETKLMELVLPTLRADFEIAETYSYVDGPPLDCPISAFGGTRDRRVSREALEAWSEQTESSFGLWILPGGHFFLNTSKRELLAVLSRDLNRLVGMSISM